MIQTQSISVYFLIILPLLLLSCNPMELKYTDVIPISSETPSEKFDPLEKSQNSPLSLLNRSAQTEFKEHFLSDSIDMVFVLDTSPGMEEFYQNNSFGAGFLSQFQNYDWKLAYTDMSVDVQKIAEEDKTEEEEEASCNLLAGLAMTAGGFLLGQGSPLLTGFGIREMGKCKLFAKDSDSSQTKYANGDFLPFEYKGEPVQKQAFYQITKNTASYNIIFDHSLRKNNPTKEKKPNYSAPILRQTKSYPFLSMAFSMARALNAPQNSSENKISPSFFRKDSLIVYVLVTTQDMTVSVPYKKFSESIESVFGSQERFKLILITLTDNSPLFCNLKLQETSTDSKSLLKLAKDSNYHSLDICSNQLGKKLFNEISKNLYSKNLLN